MSLSFLPPILSSLVFHSLLARLPCFCNRSIFDGLQYLFSLLDSLTRGRRRSPTDSLLHLQPREFLHPARDTPQAILEPLASTDARRPQALPRNVRVRDRDGVLLRQRGEMLVLERAGVRRDVVRRLGEEIVEGEEEERGGQREACEDGAVAREDGPAQRGHADVEQCGRERFVGGDEGLDAVCGKKKCNRFFI
jgi:hypothetical protein